MAAFSPPLRIAVLGAGRIGSAFAYQLARVGGYDVTVVARPGSSRLRQLEQDGAIVDSKGERATVQVTATLDEAIPYDLVIVTLLSHQVDAVLPELRHSAAKCVQFMFNTFDPERLQAEIGVERCAFGMQFIQANLDPDGRLKVIIGKGQKIILSRQHWVDVFKAAGLPATLEPDMALWLRCHAPVCVAFESISIAGMRRGGGASWGEAYILARGIHESFKLIEALGYELYPKSKKRISGLPAFAVAAMLWAVSRIRSFRELLATGKAECCALVDSIVMETARAKPAILASAIQAMRPL